MDDNASPTPYAPVGYITAEEVSNVWTEAMRRLDESVPHGGIMPKRVFLDFFEAVKFDLFKRAKGNFQEMTRAPSVGLKEDPVEAEAKRKAEADRNMETWKKRTSLGRQYAMQDSK